MVFESKKIKDQDGFFFKRKQKIWMAFLKKNTSANIRNDKLSCFKDYAVRKK